MRLSVLVSLVCFASLSFSLSALEIDADTYVLAWDQNSGRFDEKAECEKEAKLAAEKLGAIAVLPLTAGCVEFNKVYWMTATKKAGEKVDLHWAGQMESFVWKLEKISNPRWALSKDGRMTSMTVEEQASYQRVQLFDEAGCEKAREDLLSGQAKANHVGYTPFWARCEKDKEGKFHLRSLEACRGVCPKNLTPPQS